MMGFIETSILCIRIAYWVSEGDVMGKKLTGIAIFVILSAALVAGVVPPQPAVAAVTTARYIFDANGGVLGTVQKDVKVGGQIGQLPTPTRHGYTFMGWRTQKQREGTAITATTVASKAGTTTIYARWAPVAMYQGDPRWANYPYSGYIMSQTACGPSSASIAVRAITGKDITPLTAVKWSKANGYELHDVGRTKPGFFTAWPATYGVKVTAIPGGSSATADAAALAAVKRGDWVIAYMKPGNWTHTGHYILWYDVEGDRALVRDPYANKESKTRGQYKLLQAQSHGYYIVTVPDSKKLWNTAPSTTVTQFTLSQDMNGDGRGEILAVHTTGDLYMYPGQKSYEAGTKAMGTGIKVDSGLGGMQVYGPGDLNSDGCSDIITIHPNGDLYLYPGTCNGKINTKKKQKVGWGWTNWRLIPSGDLNGDKKNDLLGINSSGLLFMYPGLGDGTFGSRQQVGYGWNGWELYSAGDLNNDGINDILGINSKGDLYRYYGKGNGQFHPREKTGNGWQGWILASGADLTGDGRADIVGLNIQTGNIYFYLGKGNGFGQRVQIATSF